MKKCKTSLVCRNGLCWWVISSEFCFNQYMISMLTRLLVVSCIWFSALCVCDCVYQSAGLQQCRDYPRVDITIRIQGWVLQSLKLTSWWLCSITGPPDVGFLQGKRDNCEEHNITNQPLMRCLSRENFAHNETSLVQADNEANKNDLLDIQLIVLLHPDQRSDHLEQRAQHFDPQRGRALSQWGRALEGERRSHLCQPSTGDFRLWLG